MCGLLNPTSGEILADMMDIHKIGVNNYRNAIACVLQDDRLFSGSIAENISGFEVNANREWIVAVRCTATFTRKSCRCRWVTKP